LTHPIIRFITLPFRDKRILVSAAVRLVLIATMLRLLGFRQASRVIGGMEAKGRVKDQELSLTISTAYQTNRMLLVASRQLPIETNCLSRSMTLCWLLRASRVPCKLCFGAKREGAHLKAHAWVEVEGIVVNDQPDVASTYPSFTALGSHPETSQFT
jgi:hypothetical protein